MTENHSLSFKWKKIFIFWFQTLLQHHARLPVAISTSVPQNAMSKGKMLTITRLYMPISHDLGLISISDTSAEPIKFHYICPVSFFPRLLKYKKSCFNEQKWRSLCQTDLCDLHDLYQRSRETDPRLNHNYNTVVIWNIICNDLSLDIHASFILL